LGVKLVIVHANSESEFDAAFATVTQQKGEAILVCASPFFNISAPAADRVSGAS